MTSLTQNEITALKICLNYDSREVQLDDNYSNGNADEFAKALGWDKQQVGGLITSLEQKGLAFKCPDGYDIVWLTDDGVNAIFDVIDAEKKPRYKDVADAPAEWQL